jgi:hypothetical protein
MAVGPAAHWAQALPTSCQSFAMSSPQTAAIAAVLKFCASWPALADVTASRWDGSGHSYRRDGWCAPTAPLRVERPTFYPMLTPMTPMTMRVAAILLTIQKNGQYLCPPSRQHQAPAKELERRLAHAHGRVGVTQTLRVIDSSPKSVQPAFDMLAQAAARTYSMTSSAPARTAGGTTKPSSPAVLRLSTSSNLVGCATGRLAGLAPFRILPT